MCTWLYVASRLLVCLVWILEEPELKLNSLYYAVLISRYVIRLLTLLKLAMVQLYVI